MGNSSLLDRRKFLLGVVPAATLGTLGVSACSNNGPTSTPSSYAPTYFNTAEWAFIHAAVGRLIPSEGAGPGGVDAGVPEFIDREMARRLRGMPQYSRQASLFGRLAHGHSDRCHLYDQQCRRQ